MSDPAKPKRRKWRLQSWLLTPRNQRSTYLASVVANLTGFSSWLPWFGYALQPHKYKQSEKLKRDVAAIDSDPGLTARAKRSAKSELKSKHKMAQTAVHELFRAKAEEYLIVGELIADHLTYILSLPVDKQPAAADAIQKAFLSQDREALAEFAELEIRAEAYEASKGKFDQLDGLSQRNGYGTSKFRRSPMAKGYNYQMPAVGDGGNASTLSDPNAFSSATSEQLKAPGNGFNSFGKVSKAWCDLIEDENFDTELSGLVTTCPLAASDPLNQELFRDLRRDREEEKALERRKTQANAKPKSKPQSHDRRRAKRVQRA